MICTVASSHRQNSFHHFESLFVRVRFGVAYLHHESCLDWNLQIILNSISKNFYSMTTIYTPPPPPPSQSLSITMKPTDSQTLTMSRNEPRKSAPHSIPSPLPHFEMGRVWVRRTSLRGMSEHESFSIIALR
jgi:hypothetical protein